jgi:hypothetical protein
MRADKLGMKFIFFLAALAMANGCLAAGNAIEIVKAEGAVATRDSSGKRERAVATKSVLPPKNILTTGPNGRAVVRMGNAGFIVLEKNSKVELGNPQDHAGFLRQISGMIYYALNTIKGEQKLEVRTRTATIGIRGTRFLITDLPDRNEIDMRKGLVSVTSPDGDFEIHKKVEQDEFAASQQAAKDAIDQEKRKFEEYKASAEREFVEYQREFSLGANRMASFDGKRVVDSPLSAESEKDLETIEFYADEWLKRVRD